jgi:hypothetical protein
MIEQHEQIGKFVTKEQQVSKELVAAAEARLKTLRLETQKDCKASAVAFDFILPRITLIVNCQILEARLHELDKENLEMEQVHLCSVESMFHLICFVVSCRL